MKFAHPEFLYALFALAIPVLIHLFNFRRFKTVYFTNVRFLKELQEQTKRQSQLKHYLVLLSRLLAIAFLVFAFAGPYRADEAQGTAQKNFVSIYLDNSFSMDGQSSEGRLFDVAKQRAIELVESYRSSDRFQLVTNDFEGKHQRWLSQESVVNEMEQIVLSPSVRSLQQVYNRQIDMRSNREEEGRFTPFWFSDFQQSSSDFSAWQPDSAFPVQWVRFTPQIEQNLYIDSIAFERPVRQADQTENMNVWVRFLGNEERSDIPLRLNINGTQKAITNFSIEPGERKMITLSYLNGGAGLYKGEIALEDYPITFDDQFFFQYQIRAFVRVLEIHEDVYSASPLTQLFQRSEFEYDRVQIKSIDYGALNSYDLVILNNPKEIPSGLATELNRFTQAGGTMTVFAGPNTNNTLALGALGIGPAMSDTLRLSSIEYRHPLFTDVFEAQPERMDFPTVYKFRPVSIQPQAETLMEMENGLPFLYRVPNESGQIYVFVTDLENASGNFARHALFPPTLYNMAYLSIPQAPLYQQIGRNELIELKGIIDAQSTSDVPYMLTGENSSFIPPQRQQQSELWVETFDLVEQAGIFQLNRMDSTCALLAFNYDRRESDPSVWSRSELLAAISTWPENAKNDYEGEKSQLAGLIQKETNGGSLWKIAILLTLLFVLIEVLLLKFWK